MSTTPVNIVLEQKELTVSEICNLVESGEQVFLGNPTDQKLNGNHVIVAGYDNDDYWEALYCRLPTWYVMKVWVVVQVNEITQSGEHNE